MEYGILIALGEDNSFQIVGAVDSIEEANELAENYMNIGPDAGYVAPYEFQIHRRNDGGYTKIERFGLPALGMRVGRQAAPAGDCLLSPTPTTTTTTSR